MISRLRFSLAAKRIKDAGVEEKPEIGFVFAEASEEAVQFAVEVARALEVSESLNLLFCGSASEEDFQLKQIGINGKIKNQKLLKFAAMQFQHLVFWGAKSSPELDFLIKNLKANLKIVPKNLQTRQANLIIDTVDRTVFQREVIKYLKILNTKIKE
ncbi:DUF6913 domain-containing protein [Salegentibacter sp. HM20]